ncbi:hypothetical protein B0H13DRAFT_1861505 [Mycena leptocephala]|nr:hypothetical protein B0H13DRAFT_1861469 [Mycena leptocephala]KAJ7927319.1 hypothetical protein B0H13DRAFT_1861505 [Mycena leptocephala]
MIRSQPLGSTQLFAAGDELRNLLVAFVLFAGQHICQFDANSRRRSQTLDAHARALGAGLLAGVESGLVLDLAYLGSLAFDDWRVSRPVCTQPRHWRRDWTWAALHRRHATRARAFGRHDTRYPIPDANLHGKQEKGIDRQGHGAWMGRDEALYNDKEVLRVAIIAGYPGESAPDHNLFVRATS